MLVFLTTGAFRGVETEKNPNFKFSDFFQILLGGGGPE